MTTQTHFKTDFKALAQQYEVEIEGWYLFYESFIEYENAFMAANGILVAMMSEVIKAESKSPENEKIKQSRERVLNMFAIIEKFEGLNSRCNNLQVKLKKSVGKQLLLEKQNEDLKLEILAIKSAINEQA